MQLRKPNSKQQIDETESLNQLLRNMQSEEFIDPEFPHVYENIYHPSTPIEQIEQVIWVPCQQLHHKPFYSTGDFSLDQINNITFVSSTINHALILMKFFTPQIFAKLTKNRKLHFEFQNTTFKHFYIFDIFLKKEQKKLFIDSCVPVSEIKNKELFSQNVKGCVFPCLLEKAIAKICEGYQNVGNMRLTDMIQLLTGYPSEKFKIKDMIEGFTDENERIFHMEKFINQKVVQQKKLLFFRTRNNSKLVSFGLKPNNCYLIAGQLDKSVETDEKLISLLELPQNQRNSSNKMEWIGKFSKHRTESNTTDQSIAIKELRQYENFMSLRDLTKLTKEFIMLHNTTNYQSQSKKFSFNFINLSRNYQQEQLQPNNLLIEEDIKSQVVHFSQGSQRNLSPTSKSNSLSKVMYSSNDEVNQQRVNEMMLASNKKIELYLLWEAIEITVQTNHKDLKIDRKQKMLINLRVEWQNEENQNQTDFLTISKVTVVVLEGTQNKILMTKNTHPKPYRSRLDSSFDILFELSQNELALINESLKVIVLVDAYGNQSRMNRQNIKLKVTSFSAPQSTSKPLLINSLGSSFKFNNSSKSINSPLPSLIKDFLKTMLLQSVPTHSESEQPFHIICRQFIDKLGLGVICIRMNDQKKPNEQADIHTVQIEVNTHLMIEHGISLLYRAEDLQSYSLTKNDHLLTYTIQLSSLNQPEFILLFRINYYHQINHQSFTQPKTLLQFPPLNSIKISRISQVTI